MPYNPKVSIVIPLYNSAEFIEETIQSCLNQTYKNIEIIIVDDDSTDSSYEIARSYESNIVTVYRQKNGGACRARNLAFESCLGEYIQYLDADDLISSDKIEKQLALLVKSGAKIASCKWIKFKDTLCEQNYIDETDHQLQQDLNARDYILKMQMTAVHSWLTHRDLIYKAGPWNERITIGQDGEFFTRVAVNTNIIKYALEPIAYYRIRTTGNNSISSKYDSTGGRRANFFTISEVEKTIKKHYVNDKSFNTYIANRYQNFIFRTYPFEKDLLSKATQKIKEHGGSDIKFEYKGKSGVLQKMIGWKVVKRLKTFLKS